MTDKAKTSDVLDTAANLIEVNGWAVGTWGTYGAPMCLEGGILAALDVDESFNEAVSVYQNCDAFMAVKHFLFEQEKVASPEIGLNAYNDRNGTTKEDVISAIRGAANQQREKGN